MADPGPLGANEPRNIYYVLGKSSLGYAERCIASLIRSTTEDLSVTILTDSPEDAVEVARVVNPIFHKTEHRVRTIDEVEARARSEIYYADFPAIRRFREGHPCWRKVTDPQMYAKAGDDVIILDPDVYFPNPFAFEPAPDFGLALMYQVPNCLLPEEVVRRAFDQNITMIDHTDIGVCQYRSPLDLRFLEQLIEQLSAAPLPRSMHIESIIWAALAAQCGGGFFQPAAWHCYRNSIPGRIARRLGRSGVDSLRQIDFKRVKAFHAGGEAKHWLVEAENAGVLAPLATNIAPTSKGRFTAFRRGKFERKMRLRHLAAKTGLSKLWQ
ncbi:hypothetical protein M9978_10285 [Sphingomonas sp. MG17]|uniref:Uncharacterized protein n=1 Tax=Sphingomonas tagetis TaxID=2949092 RepID=A0A9X2HIW7_9SPHN|nr:hypothetical protein [Sphingomonas tagetis]MCP3730817.1 hypothetical protein [Sphingomonas tagetis]